ncbi:hypothetical protein [Billgrantia gudaonensis]|uniref:Uncharacterized protein n=1 Tax=Billgrantia gudaonensis TaxID=376427 RepID=A0A1G8N8B4_9GAMM|nr:hypothetical protein [Halomonas gudaonensis]SDI76316.1 hypothetical protein SAMN04487954_101251 [Halomonas gudaonensis]
MATDEPSHASLADWPAARRATPPRASSRWWLAGLLVSCLLPVGLSHVESPRLTERIAQICILAPALMRVRCRREARRRAQMRWPILPQPRSIVPSAFRVLPVLRWAAALDVLTRRGPPRTR